MFYDHHVHSVFSFDSEAPPEQTICMALEKGLKGVTFTEHFDTHPDEWEGCVYDDAAICAEHERLKKVFGDQIFIGKGIEICYQPGQMEFVMDQIAQWRFDVIMFSVHWADRGSAHHREYWDDIKTTEGLHRYLETVKEAVEWVRAIHDKKGKVFDVLGHLDWACRYTSRYFDEDPIEPFRELVSDILKMCVDADIVPEANTSGYRSGLNRPMPGFEAMKEYVRLGGKAMTVGSDAHKSEQVGTALSDAAAMMKRAGLEGTAYFIEREMKILPYS